MTPLIKLRRPNKSVTGSEPSFLTKLIASGLFSGYIPAASGTVGSLLAVGVYDIPGFEYPLVFTTIIIIALLIGIKTAGVMEQHYGHDPAEVTIDEIVGMWISLFLLPKNILLTLAAFFLFRFFDIIKPFPAREFDNMHGGFGIMMDDVIAGMYANIILQLVVLIPIIKVILVR